MGWADAGPRVTAVVPCDLAVRGPHVAPVWPLGLALPALRLAPFVGRRPSLKKVRAATSTANS
jgi:hypothetical protein